VNPFSTGHISTWSIELSWRTRFLILHLKKSEWPDLIWPSHRTAHATYSSSCWLEARVLFRREQIKVFSEVVPAGINQSQQLDELSREWTVYVVLNDVPGAPGWVGSIRMGLEWTA
jgi:hypothetical protein